MEYGLYVHLPFCRQRCRYCDFHSAPAGEVPQAYVAALGRCFEQFAPRDAAGNILEPSTVYFGGGTPSLATPAQIAELLALFCPAPGAEVTLEANPESATAEKLAGWRAAGVNRLSFGVQAADDAMLAALGRLHTAGDARRALRDAKAAGFENISGDIMLALPGYTNAAFNATLQLLAEGGATHISAYLLKPEPGTPLGDDPPANLPGPDAAADFYTHAAGRLEAAGFARYEISNFARPGFESRHNLIYWDAGSWLGIGAAAHSCLFGRRFSFAANTAAFTAGSAQPVEEGAMTAEDYIMLRLRLAQGLDEAALLARYGASLSQGQRALLERLCANGMARRTTGGWALTTAGLLVQNSILAQLLP